MINLPKPLSVHKGHTTHRRFKPFLSAFRYRMFLIEVDIDRLDEAGRQCRLFSTTGAALFSFKRKDHGDLGQSELRGWAADEFAKAGVDISEASVGLITLPRHLFYKFAPISIWIARGQDGSPVGVLYEVRNTFGDRHIYAARIDGEWDRHNAPKSFHVSPFFDISGRYQFSLRSDANELHLGVTTIKDGQPLHMATLATRRKPATDRAFLSAFLTMPFSTLGVSIAIHWEALKLWLKGAKYHSRPETKRDRLTVARSANSET
ncbi:DUF1365 domain-containing protein [Henriciella litoralis]|uniref:DUF1365 domain-containing protein n=1 Tax=Henriciella litoralis TaxID=568102 RepID=UPI00146A999A|nr:DUF1365 domain-containing protein [Henriciella litoralis]